MKQFFKFMFASMLGTFLMLGLLFAITAGIIGMLVSSVETDKEITVKQHSVLHLDLTQSIPDRSSNNPFDNFNFNTFEANPIIGLNEILRNIEKAKRDENIDGIFLNSTFIGAGFATIEEIREALIDFKSSGKFIYSYAEGYSQGSYYLASVADEIHMNPVGYFDLKGLSAQLMFFKGAMEKLEIEPQVFRHGKFKSAVEPFILDKMSASNRKQSEQFIGSFWNHMLKGMAVERNMEASKINQLASKLTVNNADDALSNGLIDFISYQDQILDKLKMSADSSSDLELVKLAKYRRVKVKKDIDHKIARENKIAIVYASGEIRSGKSTEGVMGSETIAKALKVAREDENVKAIILRVNSPGGSALASDVILREAKLAKDSKPLIVSMGDVAASGGYYIACNADKIIASENTITGSIGVFGLIPNMKEMFNNKLGITFDTVKTNPHSDINTVFRPLNEYEKNFVQATVEKIYDDFLAHVAEGRSMTVADVDSIGQGRVWSGTDALNIGLVDEIGGLERAIEVAIEMASLEKDYRIKELPKEDDPFSMVMQGFSSKIQASILASKFGVNLPLYDKIENNLKRNGIFMRMPFDYLIN